jgi:hypothetical protein
VQLAASQEGLSSMGLVSYLKTKYSGKYFDLIGRKYVDKFKYNTVKNIMMYTSNQEAVEG